MILYLEVSIESDSSLVLIAGSQRSHIEHLLERCTRSDGTSFPGFETSNILGVLRVNHSYFAVLYDEALET